SKLTPTEVFIHMAIMVKDPAFWALHDLCITMSA
ncbi:rplA family protein, partial [Pseudomonas syringae pv. japonica str. M301072]